MSSSTTATTSYILNKYSRSYPKKSSDVFQQDTEWQHFSSPVIRLVLDVKKSVYGKIESMRLRIVWSMSPDLMDTTQQDTTFVRGIFMITTCLAESSLCNEGGFGHSVVLFGRRAAKSTTSEVAAGNTYQSRSS